MSDGSSSGNGGGGDERSGPARSVLVRFVCKTQDPELEVPDTALEVPQHLARFGLSEVVNALLGNTDPVPFDFLVNDVFLRTSLAQYLKTNNISEEVVIELEYLEAMREPEPAEVFTQDDWISAVASLAVPPSGPLIATASFDSMVRLWAQDGESPLASLEGCGDTATAVALCGSDNDDGSVLVFAGSNDRTVRSWRYDVETQAATPGHVFLGHEEAIASLAVHQGGRLVASGGWDAAIRVWAVDGGTPPPAPRATGDGSEPEAKRKKADAGGFEPCGSVTTLNKHSMVVSDLVWPEGAGETAHLYSASHDHSLCIFDVESGVAIVELNGTHAAECLAVSPWPHHVLVSGHHDGCLRIWDTRDSAGTVRKTYKSHPSWVSAVAWHPTAPHVLASASYDGTVKFWDVRSSTPLHTVTDHTDRVMTCAWLAGDETTTLLSGGVDTVLRAHTVANIAAGGGSGSADQ